MDSYITNKECPVPEPFRAHLGSILFLTLLFFLTFLGRFIFAPLMPTIVQELGITPGQAGSLFLMISLGFFVAQVCSGFLSASVNHKGTLIISILGLGLALIIFNLSISLWVMRCILFALGMAAGLHLPSAIATITAMVNRQEWGKALALHQSAPPLSLVLGPLFTILLLPLFSWQAILAIIGAISIVAGAAFGRFARCGEFPGDIPRPAVVKLVVRQRSFWVMVVLFAFAIGGSVGIYAMLPLYLVSERGFDVGWANTLLGLSRVSVLFTVFIAGWLTDRFGTKVFIFIVMLTAGVATIMLGTTSGGWLLVMLFIQPPIIGCYFTAGFSALARIVQPNLRSVVASFTTPAAFLMGGGILPMVLGYIGQEYSFGLGIVLIGCLTILASGFVFFIRLIDKMEEGC